MAERWTSSDRTGENGAPFRPFDRHALEATLADALAEAEAGSSEEPEPEKAPPVAPPKVLRSDPETGGSAGAGSAGPGPAAGRSKVFKPLTGNPAPPPDADDFDLDAIGDLVVSGSTLLPVPPRADDGAAMSAPSPADLVNGATLGGLPKRRNPAGPGGIAPAPSPASATPAAGITAPAPAHPADRFAGHPQAPGGRPAGPPGSLPRPAPGGALRAPGVPGGGAGSAPRPGPSILSGGMSSTVGFSGGGAVPGLRRPDGLDSSIGATPGGKLMSPLAPAPEPAPAPTAEKPTIALRRPKRSTAAEEEAKAREEKEREREREKEKAQAVPPPRLVEVPGWTPADDDILPRSLAKRRSFRLRR